LILFFKEGLW